MLIHAVFLSHDKALFQSMRYLLICVLGCMVNVPVHAKQNLGTRPAAYYEIPAGRLSQALANFAMQNGIALSFDTTLTENLMTTGLKGHYGVQEGFDQLLLGTSLQLVADGDGTWSIQKQFASNPVSDAIQTASPVVLEPIYLKADTPRTTKNENTQKAEQNNLDLVHSINDIQPYKIIDRAAIGQSAASSVNELLQKVLLSNHATQNWNGRGFMGNTTQVNLRGLGTQYTLILVNGRRAAGTGYRGSSESTDQQNINNIPLAAIERIEILPTTAAAIYGGSAIGGVINVVLRKQYIGNELSLSYENSFDSDSAVKTINFMKGMLLQSSQTSILITGQKTLANEMLNGDRAFQAQQRAQILANDSGQIYTAGGHYNPPAGSLVNIKTQDGSALLPQYSDASFAYLPQGYAGYAQDGFEPLKDSLGKYNLEAYDGLSAYSRDATLLAGNRSESLAIHLLQPIQQKLDYFLDVSYDHSTVQTARATYDRLGIITLDANAKNNPFGKTILISYPIRWQDAPQRYRNIQNKNKKIITGFLYRPSENWRIDLEYMWSSAHIDMAHPRLLSDKFADDYNAGVIDFLRDTTTFQTMIGNYWKVSSTYTDEVLQSYLLRSTGSFNRWYAGKINAVWGVEYQTIHSQGIPEYSEQPVFHQQKQNVQSIYTEWNVPLLSEQKQLPGFKSLVLQLAARYEKINIEKRAVNFDATLPTMGLKWIPHDDFIFRGSYSLAYNHPTLSQRAESISSTRPIYITNPANGESISTYVNSGGNPDLKSEKIKNINIGFVYIPKRFPDIRWSIDYYKIQKNNSITTLSAQDIFNNAHALTELIEQDEKNNITRMNTTPFNALDLTTSTLDVAFSMYLADILSGLNIAVDYSHMYNYKLRVDLNKHSIENIDVRDTQNSKNRLAASAILHLTDQWSLGWGMQYYGQYKIPTGNQTAIAAQGNDRVASQIFHDIFIRYQMPKQPKHTGASLSIGIKNLFNQYAVDMSQDYISAYADPRLQQYYLNLKFSF
ncbi:TonB-dependent receptor [Acinetobacter larvae]|uniref:Secretin/TonB short N-terminal domain-containing protein n=1 Tax=Acinetobacter larvae TaxID=1789224 RepID=A0A1B2LZN6_9GAMM|nr:TonB-dependent receptor [Acinetobacter larvae]AOA58371.1 hypothetical protein BFG52_08400 [Acinetobacter larvae]